MMKELIINAILKLATNFLLQLMNKGVEELQKRKNLLRREKDKLAQETPEQAAKRASYIPKIGQEGQEFYQFERLIVV